MLTLPILVSKYKHGELETKFKKSYSIISQASQGMDIELGSCEPEQVENISRYIGNNLKVLKSGKYSSRDLNYQFKTYNLVLTDAKIHPNCFDEKNGQDPYSYIVTSDGSTFAFCKNRSYAAMVSIDTNGFDKGPNAFGLFYFNKGNCKITPFNAQWRTCYKGEDGCEGANGKNNFGFKWTVGACSKISQNNENGFVCSKYAINSACPDDKTKNYWECLP